MLLLLLSPDVIVVVNRLLWRTPRTNWTGIGGIQSSSPPLPDLHNNLASIQGDKCQSFGRRMPPHRFSGTPPLVDSLDFDARQASGEKPMKRVMLVIGLLSLVTAACGAGEETSPAQDPVAEEPQQDDGATPEQDVEDIVEDVADLAEVDIDDVFVTEGGTGTVSIGGETWQFELSDDYPIANCDADFFAGDSWQSSPAAARICLALP